MRETSHFITYEIGMDQVNCPAHVIVDIICTGNWDFAKLIRVYENY